MKKIIDKFSTQSATYKKFRPTYPKALYDEILQHVSGRDACWDCGTGNGQVAVALSAHFKKVYATDISENQIGHAARRNNIVYSLQRAEKSNFDNESMDLITVGQAVHWFDFEAFNREAHRVLIKNGIVAIWGYGQVITTPEVDKIIARFYSEVVGKYWDAERRHVENEYVNIPLDFQELKVIQPNAIKLSWDLASIEGFINSWSSVQNYLNAHQGDNPVPKVMKEIEKLWPDDEIREIRFPLFLRVGKK